VTTVVLWGTVLLRAPSEKVPQSGAVLRLGEAPKMQEVLPEEVVPGWQELAVPQREQAVAVGRS
jgi:hypothetical protein